MDKQLAGKPPDERTELAMMCLLSQVPGITIVYVCTSLMQINRASPAP